MGCETTRRLLLEPPERERRPDGRARASVAAAAQARERRLGRVGPAELGDHPLARVDDGVEVDARLDAEAVEHVHHVLRRHLPARGIA